MMIMMIVVAIIIITKNMHTELLLLFALIHLSDQVNTNNKRIHKRRLNLEHRVLPVRVYLIQYCVCDHRGPGQQHVLSRGGATLPSTI